jgi:hypothetical protein
LLKSSQWVVFITRALVWVWSNTCRKGNIQLCQSIQSVKEAHPAFPLPLPCPFALKIFILKPNGRGWKH